MIEEHRNNPEAVGAGFRAKVICAGVATLAAISYIDYLTRFQFLLFIFYFIPVSLCGWYLGRSAVVGMAILTGVSWCFVDILAEHHYPHEAFRYCNSLICFIAFATIGLLLQRLRQSLQEQVRVRRQLEQTLDDLTRSTEQARNLQKQLHVVCAWSKKIKVEGRWVALDEFLRDNLNAKVTYGVSPEAMEEVLQSAEKVQELA